MTHQRHDDNSGHNSTSTVAARAAAAETRVDPAHQTQSASISRKGPAVVQPRPIQAVAAAMSQFALDQDAQEEMGAAYREFGDLGASGDSPRGEEQLEIHAAQLADQLRRHQEALDQRAEQLQLQEDALGEQLQSARAWLAQRDRQLDERETSLDIRARSIAAREKESSHRPAGRSGAAGGLIAPSRKSAGSPVHEHRQEESGSPAIELEQLRQSLRRREVQMEQRLAGVRGQEAELARRSDQIERRQAEVVAAEQRIAERQHEIQLAIKRFERMGAAHERLERIDEEEAQHAARSRYLDQAEALLEQDQRELAEAQSRLEEERSQLRRELHDQRETMAAELAEAKADLGRQRARHSQRAAELDRREAAVTKLRDQLASIQRDTLEMRLTVEELWSKVSGATTPPGVTQSLAQIRTRLGDLYRLEREELGRRRAELEELLDGMTKERTLLDQRRGETDRLLAAKNKEIEADAARLVARERELGRRQAEMVRAQRAWSERDAVRRVEIRRLLAELRKSGSKEAA